MDSSPSETGDFASAVPVERDPGETFGARISAEVLPDPLVRELWTKAEAGRCGLSPEEFASILVAVGARVNHGLPGTVSAKAKEKADFFRSLHLPELALAHACALGRDTAWEWFLQLYRAPLIQAAVGITGSSSLGAELADALYAELYGLREREGERRCPLASYSGRGSLLSWLRTTLVQRYRDHYRRTRREAPLDGIDCPAAEPATPINNELVVLRNGLEQVLRELDAEDRFLLAAYFLDRQTLLQIALTLNVHEATISRRIKRLTLGMRSRLLEQLQHRGLSKAAAEEALGVDPRDIEINLRALLQTSHSKSFLEEEGDTRIQEPEKR